jgi:hypothetical protein
MVFLCIISGGKCKNGGLSLVAFRGRKTCHHSQVYFSVVPFREQPGSRRREFVAERCPMMY